MSFGYDEPEIRHEGFESLLEVKEKIVLLYAVFSQIRLLPYSAQPLNKLKLFFDIHEGPECHHMIVQEA